MAKPAHPVKGVLATRRILIVEAARLYGCHHQWLGRVLNGYDKPPPRLKKFFSELLDLPEDELFHDHEKHYVRAGTSS